MPQSFEAMLSHRLIGFDRNDSIERGFAELGKPVPRESFVFRTDDQLAYARIVANGVGIGFLIQYTAAQLPGVRQVLPVLPIPALPCWLAVHREAAGSQDFKVTQA